MRRRRGGLVGTMARTAVIAGTATAVAGGVSHHQQQKYANQNEQAQMQAQFEAQQAAQAQAAMQQAAPAGAPASSGISEESMAKLQQLSQLKDQGILSQEEFDRQKMLILG